MKIYNVNPVPPNQLNITGKGNDKLWAHAANLIDFCSPWEDIKNKETTFKALWDWDYLFFCFKVMDGSLHIDKTDNSFRVSMFPIRLKDNIRLMTLEETIKFFTINH